MPSLTLFKFLLIFLLIQSVAVQNFDSEKPAYKCKRLVHEKDRCLIYNYNHPLCKKWDRSNCPPPRIHKERGPCVSYKCTRLEWKQNPRQNLTVTNSTALSREEKPVLVVPPVPLSHNFTTPNRTEEHNFTEDIRQLRNDLDGLKSAQEQDVRQLDAEKNRLDIELNQIRTELRGYGEAVQRLDGDAENPSLDRLHEHKSEVEADLQNLEEKIFQTNFTLVRRLVKLEDLIADLQNLVNRLHEESESEESNLEVV